MLHKLEAERRDREEAKQRRKDKDVLKKMKSWPSPGNS